MERTWDSIYQDVKTKVTKCKCCPVCNGYVCKGQLPGVGGKGSGSSFIRNVEKLKEVRVVMDVLHEPFVADTSLELFGKTFAMPVFAAPIAGIRTNYGADMSDEAYADILVEGCKNVGSLAFCGDGPIEEMFSKPLQTIHAFDGHGVATMKPWLHPESRLQLVKELQPFALAIDVDSAGLPALQNIATPVSYLTHKNFAKIKSDCDVPLIIKGVMNVRGAKEAILGGADAIVVSNHGGRVLDDSPATIEVLAEIVEAVNGKCKILVDGGIRSGLDVFKALALGADAVLIGRPVPLGAIEAGVEGIEIYFTKIMNELKQTMLMCNCRTLADITKANIQYR